MCAEQPTIDHSPQPVATETRVWSDEHVKAALEAVVATFDEEHRPEVRDLLEGMFNLAVLELINSLPEPIQSEYLERLSAAEPAADGQTPLAWLTATAEPLKPGFSQELQHALEQVTNQVEELMASSDETPQPTL